MKQTMEEENRILSLLQSDPEAGLSEAINIYGTAVKWIARSVLGADSREDVEECVAETFVRLWQGSGSRFSRTGDLSAERTGDATQRTGGAAQPSDCQDAAPRSSLFSYVCGIARHVAIDMRRKRRAAPLPLETSPAGTSDSATVGGRQSGGGISAWEVIADAAERRGLSAEASAATGGDFAGLLARKENHKMLQEAVEELPSPDREIFLLRYWLDLRVAEVAQKLDLTEKQVENRLYRGKAALRKTLTERGMER